MGQTSAEVLFFFSLSWNLQHFLIKKIRFDFFFVITHVQVQDNEMQLCINSKYSLKVLFFGVFDTTHTHEWWAGNDGTTSVLLARYLGTAMTTAPPSIA